MSIAQRILVLRGQRVLLDADLAALYGVSARRLNEQVKRNLARFPADFVFRLEIKEMQNLKSQFATSSWGRQTEATTGLHRAWRHHGRDGSQQPRAVEMSVYVVRAFVRLREVLSSNAELARKLDAWKSRSRHLMPGHAVSSRKSMGRFGR